MDFLTWFYPIDWTLGGVIGFVIASVVRMFLLFKFGYQWADWVKKRNSVVRAINKPLLYLVFGCGFIYDVFLNYTVAVVLWMECPKQRFETITWRLDRYLKMGYLDGITESLLVRWRYGSALFICAQLDRIDAGHCGSLHNPASVMASLKGE